MIVIDYQDRTPIYEQIVDRMQMLIIKGILKPDTQLPSVRKMAMELSINPNTIQKSFAILEQQGFIYPVKGKGNFVAQNPESGLNKKKEDFFVQLKETVTYARDLKIGEIEFIQKVKQYYREGQHD